MTAILTTLDDGAREKIVEALAPAATAGRKAAVEAMTLFQISRLTFGEQWDLSNAFLRLEKGA